MVPLVLREINRRSDCVGNTLIFFSVEKPGVSIAQLPWLDSRLNRLS